MEKCSAKHKAYLIHPWSIEIKITEAEQEFEPRLKSAKAQLKLRAGLNSLNTASGQLRNSDKCC